MPVWAGPEEPDCSISVTAALPCGDKCPDRPLSTTRSASPPPYNEYISGSGLALPFTFSH